VGFVASRDEKLITGFTASDRDKFRYQHCKGCITVKFNLKLGGIYYVGRSVGRSA
jgi:hypothetical protein